MKRYTAAEYYIDTLVIQAAFGNDRLVKQAEEGFTGEIIDAVKKYVGDRYNPNDKVASIIDILAPGALTVMLRALGLGWVSFVAGLVMDYFKIPIGPMISSAVSKIVDVVKSAGEITSSHASDILSQSFSGLISQASNVNNVKGALLYKIAIQQHSLKKEAGITDIIRGKSTNLLFKVIKWIFLTVLASAAIIPVSDGIHALVGGPSSSSSSSSSAPSKVSPRSVQTKFKSKPGSDAVLNSSTATWVESGAPDASNIHNMVLDWMSEVYDGTAQYENIASTTVGFNKVVESIINYNKGNTAGKITYIPRMFTSKKDVVDVFIDDVARVTPTPAPATPETKPSPSQEKPGTIYAMHRNT